MKNQLTDEQIDEVTGDILGFASLDSEQMTTARLIARAAIAAHEAAQPAQDDASFGQDAYSFTGTLVQIVDKKVAEIAALKADLARLRGMIALDRCDGETEYAAGVNAARDKYLAYIDAVQS